jgi:hypothetical protein
MPNGHSVNEAEWKGKVESQIDTLTTGFVTLNAKVDKIFDVVNRSQKTDWQTIFAGLIVVGALYASAIRPIENEVSRADLTSNKLADAVIIQNDKINELEITAKVQSIEIENGLSGQKEIIANGTPGADKRLTVLEKQLEWSKQNGK